MKNGTSLWAVLLAALLLASVNAKAASAKAIPCPAKTFEGFLEKYMEDVELQKKYTKIPLSLMHTEDQGAKKGIVEVEKTITRAEDVKYPVMRTISQLKKDEIVLRRIEDPAPNQKMARFMKEDTGVLIKFFFQKERACWMLIRIEDWST